MQAVGKKNRTSLHSLYDFVLMTRGILCIGTGVPLTREQGDYFASEFPPDDKKEAHSIRSGLKQHNYLIVKSIFFFVKGME